MLHQSGTIKQNTFPLGTYVASDRSMLEALMGIQEQLSDKESSAFDSMLKQIKHGKRTDLTKNQREWVSKVYQDFQLDSGEVENLYSSGKVKAAPPGPKLNYEVMPKPLKPPTRRSV